MFKVEVIKTTQEFQDIREEWNNLLSESKADTIFLTWEWLFTWWEIYGDKIELRILIFRKNDSTLCGIVPLMITKRFIGIKQFRILEFIGSHSVSSEYLDFICLKEWEKEIFSSFILHIMKYRDWDLLSFYRIPEESPTVHFLKDIEIHGNIHLFTTRSEESLYITLPKSWDEYLISLGKNTRHNIRRYRMRLEKELRGTFVESKVYAEHEMEDVISLHQSRMGSLGKIGSFASIQFRQFHKKIAKRALERNWLRLFYLKMDDRNIASRYGFIYGDKFYDYNTGFDPAYEKYYVGFVLLSYCIEKCITEGIAREFDFLGPGTYKERWNTKYRKKISVVISPNFYNLKLYLFLTGFNKMLSSQGRKLMPEGLYQRLRNLKQRIFIHLGKPLR